MSSNKINVLYIVGAGRSGSTLLERIVGTVDNFLSIGESIYTVNTYLYEQHRVCDNGRKFSDNEFWSRVVKDSCSVFNINQLKKLELFRNKYFRFRKISLFSTSIWRTKQFQSELNEYLEFASCLYNAINKASSNSFIIDASKDLYYAFVLDMIPHVNIFLLHLVRDSRGVAYSWTKTNYGFHEVSPFSTALNWNVRNASALWASNKFNKYLLIKYEDFVQNPKHYIKKILSFVGQSSESLRFIKDDIINIGEGQGFCGNVKLRGKHDSVKINFDDTWKRKLPLHDKLIVTILTSPLLLKYRYLP